MPESLLDRIRRLYANLPPGALLPGAPGSVLGGAVGGALGGAVRGPTPAPQVAMPGQPGSSTRELSPQGPATGGDQPTTEWDVDPEDDDGLGEAAAATGFTKPHPNPTTLKEQYENDLAEIEHLLTLAQQAKADAADAAGAVDPATAKQADTVINQLLTRRQATRTALAAAEKTEKPPHTIQKREEGPKDRFGNTDTYLVTYKVDAQGNEVWDESVKPQVLIKRTSGETGGPTAAQENDLATAELNRKVAEQKLAEATSPEAKREAQLKLDLAEFNVQEARRKAAREDRPSILSGVPEGQEWILSRDPTTGAITRERNPAYRAPVSQIIQPGTGRTITTRDPTTGEIKTEPNPAWTPEMEEAQQLELSNLRRGQLPQNPLAAYTQEAQRLQGEAQRELDRLRDLQRTGAITATDADAQFKQYLAARVTPQLAGLKTQAEEAQRLERTQVEERNRLEGIRADTANRAREQIGYQAGETARSQIMQIAPDVRHQGFLNQYGNMVQNMAARAAAPTAEAANAMPAAPGVSADQFDISKFAGAIPNLDEAAKAATARALAGISPTAARLANLPTVNMPTGPDLQGLISQIPYQGQLTNPPPGLQPLPGMAAVDQLPFGRPGWARTTYPGVNGGVGGFQDWQIPPFGG